MFLDFLRNIKEPLKQIVFGFFISFHTIALVIAMENLDIWIKLQNYISFNEHLFIINMVTTSVIIEFICIFWILHKTLMI